MPNAGIDCLRVLLAGGKGTPGWVTCREKIIANPWENRGGKLYNQAPNKAKLVNKQLTVSA